MLLHSDYYKSKTFMRKIDATYEKFRQLISHIWCGKTSCTVFIHAVNITPRQHATTQL